MPAIETKTHLGSILTIGLDDLWHPGVRGIILAIADFIALIRSRISDMEIIGAAKVIFNPCTTYGWPILIPVHIEFYFP